MDEDYFTLVPLQWSCSSRRGLNRAGVEAKAGQGWVWVKAAWGGQQGGRNLKRINH